VRIPDAPGTLPRHPHPRDHRVKTTRLANDAPNISVIKNAAKSFGSPADTAIHPTIDRQANAATSTKVLTHAATRAHPNPRNINTPHNAESPPNIPPESNAVFAPAGFDKNPAIPQTIRKIPNPTNHFPENFIQYSIARCRSRIKSCISPMRIAPTRGYSKATMR